MDHQPGYKSKLKELQSNIKRSKLEHRELEYEFQKLIIQRNDCDRSAMKTFRHKYNSILEEDKRRITRNEKIKQMLQRIDYQASALAAKSERLKMLKTHYEKNLYRAFGPNSSRTDNSSDVDFTPKQRTKSVNAHTQIPRSNYDIFDMEDALNSCNYASSIQEPPSVSTSRLKQTEYNPAPNYDQRSTRFIPDITVNSTVQRDLEPKLLPQTGNKGVRLFYGHELMNLPNLTVDSDAHGQDSETTGQILKQSENKFELALENTTNSNLNQISKSKYQEDVDFGMNQNFTSPQINVIKNQQSSELNRGFHNFPEYQRNSHLEKDPKPQPTYSQYYQNNNISTHSQLQNFEAKTPQTTYQNSNTNQEPLHYQPVVNKQSSYLQYQLETQPIKQPPFSQYQVNKNSETPDRTSSPFNPVASTPYLQNSVSNNQALKQNQPVTKPPYLETNYPESALPYVASTENLGDVGAQNDYKPKTSFQQQSVDELESKNSQDNYQFTPKTIPEVKPITANQVEAAQISKPASPKSLTKILEVPNGLIPQGIHQVWEKVVDVEIMNPSTKPYPTETNEPRNEVIDKIYKEISSLGEIPADAENNDVPKSSQIDNRAEIIDKIEEHYYGEKIKSEEDDTDIYSNPNLNDQNYQPQPDQTEMQAGQNIDYITDIQMSQDPNTNYEIPNPNNAQQVEYQNYDINEQQYYSEQQDPSTAGHQDNYAPDPGTNYNMEQSMNDPNYMFAQNENYQNYATDDGQPGYSVEPPELQNYVVDENQQQTQQYTDEMQNQYYDQQQPNEQQYAENTNELGLKYANEVYNQNENYDQQNLNPDQYPAQYNENASEMYQEYPTDQQLQAESTVPYEYNTDYIQNDPPAISDPIDVPTSSELEDMSVNQAPSLSSIEQLSSPIIEATKPPGEIKADIPVVPKPQIETKKKRVNFLDSSDSEQPSGEEKLIPKTPGKDQSDSDFEFSVKSN